jgi:hypothetical protein
VSAKERWIPKCLNIINVLLLFPSLPFEFIFKYPATIKDFLLTLKKKWGGAPKPLV